MAATLSSAEQKYQGARTSLETIVCFLRWTQHERRCHQRVVFGKVGQHEAGKPVRNALGQPWLQIYPAGSLLGQGNCATQSSPILKRLRRFGTLGPLRPHHARHAFHAFFG